MDQNQWLSDLLSAINHEEKMTEKQRRIAEAAMEIFSEKGYSATSTSEIAQKARVAEGTIFRHYKTKKDLLLSIVGPVLIKLVVPLLVRDFQKTLDQPYASYEDFLKGMAADRMEFVRHNLPALKIMLHEIPFQPELKDYFVHHIAADVFARIQKIIEHFKEQGQLLDLPSEQIIRFGLSSMIGFIFTRFLLFPDREWDEEAEINATIRFIMHGVSSKS